MSITQWIGLPAAMLLACVSSPHPPALSPEENQRVAALARTIDSVRVSGSSPEMSPEFCALEAENLVQLLRRSGVFRQAYGLTNSESEVSLQVELLEAPHNPY